MIIDVSTKKRFELIDITHRVSGAVSARAGLCNVYVPHTTCGILVNENEPGLLKDVESMLSSAVPDREYAHNRIDNNADAHLRSVLTCASQTIPVSDGSLALGTWQRIFLAEFDGPRERKVIVTVLPLQ